MGNKKVGNISVDDLEMSTVFFKITKYITYLQRNSKRIEWSSLEITVTLNIQESILIKQNIR